MHLKPNPNKRPLRPVSVLAQHALHDLLKDTDGLSDAKLEIVRYIAKTQLGLDSVNILVEKNDESYKVSVQPLNNGKAFNWMRFTLWFNRNKVKISSVCASLPQFLSLTNFSIVVSRVLPKGKS